MMVLDSRHQMVQERTHFQYLGAECWMLPDQGLLGWREWTRLGEQPIGQRDLVQVMQEGSRGGSKDCHFCFLYRSQDRFLKGTAARGEAVMEEDRTADHEHSALPDVNSVEWCLF